MYAVCNMHIRRWYIRGELGPWALIKGLASCRDSPVDILLVA